DDPVVDLLVDPRRAAHQGRLDDGEVLYQLVDPAVDVGGQADVDHPAEQRLAEGVGQRQPEVLQVILAQDAGLRLGYDLPRPATVQQLHALGRAGRTGRVHEGGELVGADRLGDPVDEVGVVGEHLTALRLQLRQGEHRYGCLGGAVDDHYVGEVRQVGSDDL